MHSVFMNASIRNRGISGTSMIVDQIEALLERQADVVLDVAQGPAPVAGLGPAGRAIRLAQGVWWDGWAAGRRSRTDAAIYPTAVGGWLSRSGRNILIVHDLMLFDRSLEYDRGFRLTSTVTFFLSAVSADVIVTPSAWSKREIARRWPWASKKCVVVPWPSRLEPRGGPRKVWSGPGRPNVLMVSSVDPHKNHRRGIEVVERARAASGADFSLTIVGPRGRAEDELRIATALHDPQGSWIVRRDSVSDAELVELLDTSFALLNTSLAEGFGLPLLEAAARDLPVVHSRAGALNEVLPTPEGPEVTTQDLADEIVALLDPDVYAAQVERGRTALARHAPERFEAAFLSIVVPHEAAR
jgi:glycosyltransferase involved in cell wall biosynthesis